MPVEVTTEDRMAILDAISVSALDVFYIITSGDSEAALLTTLFERFPPDKARVYARQVLILLGKTDGIDQTLDTYEREVRRD